MDVTHHSLFARQADQSSDQNIGSTTQTPDRSISQLLSTFLPLAVFAGIWFLLFVILRPRFPWKYAPRTQSRQLRKDQYQEPLTKSPVGWVTQFFAIPEHHVLQNQSLDAYLFLRFLKVCVAITVVGCLITWPILFPVYATGRHGLMQLNIITVGNIAPSEDYANNFRYFALALVAWVYFGFVMWVITRETIYFINLRQAYLMNPGYRRKLPARTVLFTAVPEEYRNEAKIREILGPSVRRVWIPCDSKKIDDLVEQRDKAAMKLEAAETKLILNANGAMIKSNAAAAKANKKNGGESDAAVVEEGHADNSISRWVKDKDRPSHRLKMLVGKKVDTIEWTREELARLAPLIAVEQEAHRNGEGKKLPAVFVEFDTLANAQAAYQSLTDHRPLMMSPRYTGMNPIDVIWSNLRIGGPERFIRYAAITALVVATVVFWSIPVAFVGFISNLDKWTDPNGSTPWLSFLRQIPSQIFGIVSGLLPSVLLAVLMALLPPFLRFCAKLAGAPTRASVEYTVSNYYFAFQVVQVFLVATLTSAASSAAQTIVQNPSSVFSLLSAAIPASSNFYLSYFIVQGLGVVSGMIAAVAGLVVTPLLGKFLGSTPRKLFSIWHKLKEINYGTVYPVQVNLLVIALAYSTVAPLVLGFAAVGMFFFYFAYRYNILFVYDTGPDTQGLLYARAWRQLFVGLYVSEICLIGLVATTLGRDGKGGIGPLILLILLLIFTALYQIALNSATKPLLDALPKDLEAEEHRLTGLSDLEAAKVGDAADIDKNGTDGPAASGIATPKPKGNIITRFLKPGVYADYATQRALMPAHVDTGAELDEIIAKDAYLAPSVWSEIPRLIIPRDSVGFSGPEVLASGKVVPITDAGATIDEKNKMVLDEDKMGEFYFEEKSQRFKSEFA